MTDVRSPKRARIDGAVEIIERLCPDMVFSFLQRQPDSEELQVALGHINGAEEDKKRQAYEDVVWALLQTKEFLFNH